MEIDGGYALLEALRDAGFDVTASAWTRPTDDDDWYLYIASKEVDDRGIAAAYGGLLTTLRAKPEIGIDSSDVKLIGSQNPIAKDLLAIQGAGPPPIVKRSRRPKLGSMNVEETFVYPPVAATPVP